jgi:formate dehydrogenase major subunit
VAPDEHPHADDHSGDEVDQDWVAAEWAWAWPMNRRILYNRASADPAGKPWSDRKAYVWWDEEKGLWTGHDVPDFEADKRPDYRPPKDAIAQAALSGIDPFIMQADGKAWLFAPAGLLDGPLPAHYEPQESPFDNFLYPQRANPTREVFPRKDNAYHRTGTDPGSEVFPYIFTTYRLTEHHTAGGMSRWLPYLSELQPAMFCEISPELARERGLQHLGWATIVTARSAIEARVLVTDRITPLRVQGRTMHQIGLPYHWGPNGISRGDAANELSPIVLDPNVHIQESKAATCDIRPGRRPRGPALLEFLDEYRQRGRVEDSGEQRENAG